VTTAHAASHASAGQDPISPGSIGAASASHTHGAADVTSGAFGIGRIPVGTSSGTVAARDNSRITGAQQAINFRAPTP